MIEDADVELQYLTDELKNYNERRKKKEEEERRKQKEFMKDSIVTADHFNESMEDSILIS